MKQTMNKALTICRLLLYMALIFVSCQRHQDVSLSPKADTVAWADSLISETLATNDNDRVIALVDSLENAGAISSLKANFRRGYAYERKGMRYYTELYWKKVLEEKKPSQEDLESYIHAASFLANRQNSKSDYEGAIRTASKALEKIDSTKNPKPLFKAMLLQTVGTCLIELKQSSEADHTFDEAFAQFMLAVEGDSTDHCMRNAIIGLSNISKNYLQKKQLKKAAFWVNRADSLLTIFKNLPDSKKDKIDKMQALILHNRIGIAKSHGNLEEAERLFTAYQATDYAKTTDGRMKSISYLMKAKRYEEAVKNYALLDGWIDKKNGTLSLETIRKHYTGKFKANDKAGHRDSALVVARTVFAALDSAITDFQNSEMEELTAIYEIQQKEAEISEQQKQNEMLRQRSRFTTAGIAMVLGIAAMLVFLVINNRWSHRLEIKNRQLQRERNVVVAQNKQLAVERDHAKAASKAKTAFLQSMTHEIRTPLNSINGFTQVLTTKDFELSDEERLDFSQRIQDNTRLLTNILDDLILISEMESGNELQAPEECVVASIVLQAADAVRQFVAPGVTLDSNWSVSDDCTVITYPQMILQVLSKLLDNAVKFTTEGNITLSLDKEEERLHFSVVDTGPGIPADKREYVFERFSKLDNFAQGTGLGLTVARMVAERLNGTLTLDTEYNGGSKFDFIIPVNQNA